jgi:hypothetical protein
MAMETWFVSRQEQEIFIFSPTSRPTLEPVQPPVLLVPEALSSGVKWQGREADHSSPPTAEDKNGGAIPPFAYNLARFLIN